MGHIKKADRLKIFFDNNTGDITAVEANNKALTIKAIKPADVPNTGDECKIVEEYDPRTTTCWYVVQGGKAYKCCR
jgi:hypothetical protein